MNYPSTREQRKALRATYPQFTAFSFQVSNKPHKQSKGFVVWNVVLVASSLYLLWRMFT